VLLVLVNMGSNPLLLLSHAFCPALDLNQPSINLCCWLPIVDWNWWSRSRNTVMRQQRIQVRKYGMFRFCSLQKKKLLKNVCKFFRFFKKYLYPLSCWFGSFLLMWQVLTVPTYTRNTYVAFNYFIDLFNKN